jgi:hypothetical protein
VSRLGIAAQATPENAIGENAIGENAIGEIESAF